MKDFWIDLLTGLIKIKCNKKVSKKLYTSVRWINEYFHPPEILNFSYLLFSYKIANLTYHVCFNFFNNIQLKKHPLYKEWMLLSIVLFLFFQLIVLS